MRIVFPLVLLALLPVATLSGQSGLLGVEYPLDLAPPAAPAVPMGDDHGEPATVDSAASSVGGGPTAGPGLPTGLLGAREAPIPVGPPPPVRGGPGLGLSAAIEVVIASPAEPVDPALLARAGDGWETGHRWLPLEPRASRVLGQPVGEPYPAPTENTVTSIEPFRVDEVTAPARPGVWQLESGTGTLLTVITQVPAGDARGGRLNGYHIGVYPTAGSDRSDVYAPPSGFIEVTPANRDLRVSRHLTLAQFLTKDQFDVWPKYLALDMRLIDKLELVIQELQLMGIRADRIHVMSGFRTPQYNGPGGGGRAALSRHMWGDAADVWIDSLGDGQMDDLNGDGLIDIDDAAVIMRAVERVERKYPELVGGAGTYPTTSTHPPYIHIDARGYRSRW